MEKVQEIINSIDTKIKSFITSESSTEQVKALGEVTEDLKSLQEQYQAQEKEIKELKQTIVDQVKQTSFKEPPVDDTTPDVKSIDDLIAEEFK